MAAKGGLAYQTDWPDAAPMKIFTVFFALTAGTALASINVETLVPESALATLYFGDFGGLFKTALDWELLDEPIDSDGTTLRMKLMEEEDLTRINDRIADIEIDRKPLDFETLLSFSRGPAAFAITGMGGDEPEILMVAQWTGPTGPTLEAIQTLERSEEDAADLVMESELYRGVKLYSEGLMQEGTRELNTPEYWAVAEGLLIESTSEDMVRNAIDRLLDADATDSLAQSETFASARAQPGGDRFVFHANMKQLGGFLEDMMLRDGNELPPNPMGITNQRIVDGLGLRNFNAFYITASTTQARWQLDYENRNEGIVSLFAYGQLKSTAWPAWMPADAIEASLGSFNLSEAWRRFLNLMDGISPSFRALYQLQLDNLRNQTGIDIEAGLIENFGDRVCSALLGFSDQKSPDGSPVEKRIIAIEVLDTDRMERTLKALVDALSRGTDAIQESEIEGEIIYSIHPTLQNQGIPPIAFAFQGSFLYVATGDSDSLARVFRANRSADPSPLPSVEPAKWNLRNVTAVGHTNLERLKGAIVDFFSDSANADGLNLMALLEHLPSTNLLSVSTSSETAISGIIEWEKQE